MSFTIYGYEQVEHRIEKQVYDAFLKASDSLEKHFSFGIANWTRFGNEMESDLILVGKAGVFIVEIKGGRIDVQNGAYHQNNKPMKTTPLKQASDNYWKIINILEEKGLNKYRDVSGGYVCIFPETTWDYSADTANSTLILDYAYSQNLSQNMARIIGWFKEQNSTRGLYSGNLAPETISKIKSILVGTTKKVSDVRHGINLNKDKFIVLSEEQFERYQEISDNKHIVIKGPPGSGKTLLAFQILLDSEKNSVSTLYICKNKALATHLRHKLALELGHEPKHAVIKNIDQLARESAEAGIHYTDSDRAAISAAKRITDGSVSFTKFDYLLIDEGQDLMRDDGYIELIDTVLTGGIENGRWCLFMDFNQNLLNTHNMFNSRQIGEEAFETYFLPHATIKKLTKNYRNTDVIQRTATTLSRTQLIGTNGLMGESPEIKVFHDTQEEARFISDDINSLLDGGVSPAEMTVLSFVGRSRSVAESGLIKIKNGVKLRNINDLDLTSTSDTQNTVTFASVYEYKGLDNEIILFTDVHDIDSDEKSSALHLVGATRARNHFKMYVTPQVMHRLLDPNNGNLLHSIDPLYTS